MHETLNNRTYVGKELFFSFLGASYFTPKSAHRRENEPVLGPVIIIIVLQEEIKPN